MSRLQEIQARRRARGTSAGLFDREPRVEPPEPSLLAKATAAGLNALSTIGSVFEHAGDRQTRGLLGGIVGATPTGPDASTTGEDIVEAVAGPLPPNRVGVLEWRDVPGFVTELAASPWNVVGIGALTKAGKVAARGSKLAERAESLGALAKAAQGTEPALERAAARAAAELATIGPTRKAATFIGQSRSKQRALLKLAGTDIDLAGPLAGPVFAGLTAAGRFAKPLADVAAPLFRGMGRIGQRRYDALIEGARPVARAALREGVEEEQQFRALAKTIDAGQAHGALLAMRDEIAPLSAAAEAADPKLTRWRSRLSRLQKRALTEPDLLPDVAQLSSRIERRAARYDPLLDYAADVNEPVATLWKLAVERRDPAGRLTRASAKVAEQFKNKLDAVDAELTAATLGGNEELLRKLTGRRERIIRSEAAELALLEKRTAIDNELLRHIPADVAAEADRIAALHGGTLLAEQATGVPVGALSDPGLGYVRRYLTPEGQRFSRLVMERLPDSPFARYAERSPARGFVKKRSKSFEGLGILQINNMARAEARQLGIRFAGEFFLEDPGEIMLRRLTESGQARDNAIFLQGMVETFAHARPKGQGVGGRFVSLPEFLAQSSLRSLGGERWGKKSVRAIEEALRDTKFADNVLPREIAEAAWKHHETLRDPEEVSRIFDAIGKYNSATRFWWTGPFPAYSVRNASSNAFMMWLAGMRPDQIAAYAIRAGRIQLAGRRLGKTVGALTGDVGLDAADSAVLQGIREASRHGVIGTSSNVQFAELANVGGLARQTGQDVLRTIAAPSRSRFGQAVLGVTAGIEDNGKLALFLWAKDNGYGAEDAAALVHKYLFDYQDLSTFERKHVRRWAAFYTWQRKAFPLLISEAAYGNPHKIRAALLASGAIGGAQGNREMLTREQRSRLPVAAPSALAGLTGDPNRRLFLDLGLPLQVLDQFAPEDARTFAGALRGGLAKGFGQLNPAAQALLEFASGRDLATGKPVADSMFGAAAPLVAGGPAGRLYSTGKIIGRVAAKKRPVADLLRLVGAGTVVTSPEESRRALALERIRDIRRQLENLGRAGRTEITFSRDPQTKGLLRQLARQERLARAE